MDPHLVSRRLSWLPLAASQWQRTSILQIAAYTGAGRRLLCPRGDEYRIRRLPAPAGLRGSGGRSPPQPRDFLPRSDGSPCRRRRNRADWGLRRRSQEFFLALFLLLVCLSVQLQEAFNRAPYQERLGRVAFVQPDIPQEVKWDPAKAPGIVRTLQNLTAEAGSSRPDLILWPEASLPWPLNGDAVVRTFMGSLARGARAPLLVGALAVENAGQPGERASNAAFLVTPDGGVQPGYYAKRHLVPFGEYVPLRPLLGWLSKVVPVGEGDFTSLAPALNPW